MSKLMDKAKEEVEKFNFHSRGAANPSSIDNYLSTLKRLPPFVFIRQSIVFHEGNLADYLISRKHNGAFVLSSPNPDANVFELSFHDKSNKYYHGVFAILPSSQPDLHRVVTVSLTDFWNKAVRKLIRTSYPKAMIVFFKQNEIWDALRAVERSLRLNEKIRISDVTLKGERNSEKNARRPDIDTYRMWTDLSIDEVFNNALEQDQWFTSMKFIIQQQFKNSKVYRQISSGRIYKYGEVSCDFLYESLSKHLLPVLEKAADERISLLRKRGIRENNYKVANPLEINYGQDIFSDTQKVREFGGVISKYPNATLAVYHGNPYYHASLADFQDGSSFELWILSPERILIVPQAKSTPQALERLISYIFFKYREGKIGEYRGQP